MSLGRSEVDIEYNHCHTNTENMENHLAVGESGEQSAKFYLNVSKIIVKSTNFPSKGTTREVGGMISASRRKNTVNERRMLMERLTCHHSII